MDFEQFARIMDKYTSISLGSALNMYGELFPQGGGIVNPIDLYRLREKLNGNVHENLVWVAPQIPAIVQSLRNGQKIQAIKELRQVTMCGLKEAKDAIGDDRVWGRYNTNY